MFWHTIGLLFLGALIGWLASKIMHGKGGLIRNIIVGIAGSVLGGWLADWIGIGSGNIWSIGGFLIAVGGSCLLILVSRLIAGKRA
ncbi:MAG: GlsB/YeaQ/YmgE family stress response membrane protein [Clostridiaceae bacterium]